MTDEKKNVPKLRFPGYTDAWVKREFGDVINVINGYAFKSSDFVKFQTNRILLTPGNVQIGGGFKSEKLNYFSENIELDSKFIFDGNDIFITLTDLTPTANSLGFPAKVPNDGIQYLHNQRLGKVISKNTNRKFIYYVLQTHRYHQYMVNTSSGTTVRHSSESKVLNYSTLLPGTDEQIKISTFFNELDQTITVNERELLKLKDLKKAYLEKMFPKNGSDVPELRFPGYTDAWVKRQLGQLGSVAMNRRIFKDETSENNEIPFFKIGTFGSEPDTYITREKFEDYRSKYPYPQAGDVLISAAGSIGRTVVYQGEKAYFQDSNIVWLKHDERLLNSFLKQFYSIVKWYGLEGSTIQRLYNKNILGTEIMLPSPDEQLQISTFLEDFDDLITVNERELNKLKNLKQAYLKDMFV